MWEEHYPQYKDKYSVIYNYIEIPEAFLDDDHRYLSDGKLKISVAASYQELKNPIRVIEAVSSLSDEERARLEINWYGRIEVTTGNRATYDRAVQMIRERQLEDCIHLYPETKEIYDIMHKSDVVGLFSTVEGLPNAICEAMIIGRPIVMTRVSDYSVLVRDNGLLCDFDSTDSIKEALVELLRMSPRNKAKEVQVYTLFGLPSREASLFLACA